MNTFIHPLKTAVLAVAVLVLAGSAMAEVTVTAQFNPPTVTLGQRSSYQIVLQGGREAIRGSLPSIDGLRISEEYSSSSNFSWVNGRQTTTFIYSFPAIPSRVGDLTVPAWKLNVGGAEKVIPAATLTVVEAGEEYRDALFLRLEKPRDYFYAGETMPCTLKLYIRADLDGRVSMRTLPEKIGDAFTCTELSKSPVKSNERVDGKPYRTIIWPVALTALKGGEPVLSFEMDVTVVMPRGAGSRVGIGSIFNDPFLGGQREQRVVSTGELPVEVRDLPTEGRTDAFAGAIGAFTASSRVSTRQTSAGEPVTMTLTVTGKGNFERITPPEIPETTGIKSYPPKSSFEPKDAIGFAGEKVFEYIVIPESPEVGELPAIPFQFFDPEAGDYVDLTADAVPVKVLPAAAGSTAAVAQVTSGLLPDDGKGNETPRGTTLLPIELLPGPFTGAIAPPFKSPLFLLAQAFPLALISGIVLVRRRERRLAEDTGFARRVRGTKRTREWAAKAREAAAGGDTGAFFDAAQSALQEAVGRHFSQEPESLTLSEIDALLARREVAEETRDGVRSIFETADTLKFAGEGALGGELNLGDRDKSLVGLLNSLSSLK